MIDAHHLDGMFQVIHDIEDTRLTILTQEPVVDRGLCHTILGSEGSHLVVSEVTGVVAEGPG